VRYLVVVRYGEHVIKSLSDVGRQCVKACADLLFNEPGFLGYAPLILTSTDRCSEETAEIIGKVFNRTFTSSPELFLNVASASAEAESLARAGQFIHSTAILKNRKFIIVVTNYLLAKKLPGQVYFQFTQNFLATPVPELKFGSAHILDIEKSILKTIIP
jgi:hypothetical protein